MDKDSVIYHNGEMMGELLEIIAGLIRMTAWPMTPPPMYGVFHCAMAIGGCIAAWIMAGRVRKNKADRRLFHCGILLALMEIYKQLFCFFVLGNGTYDWWYFPFQLCSMAMYLCLVLPLCGKKGKETVHSFLASFNLTGTLAALVYPLDMLRPYWTLTMHGFLWHIILLYIAFVCIRTGDAEKGFGRAVVLFAVMALTAMGINAYGEAHTAAGNTWPDMFYISLHHPSDQPFFGALRRSIGCLPANLVYLAMIALTSWILVRLQKKT